MCLGIPGKVIEITDDALCLARVEIAGVRREVNLACVLEEGQSLQSLRGQWVIVHVGFALSRIDPDEAQRTLRLLAEMGGDEIR